MTLIATLRRVAHRLSPVLLSRASRGALATSVGVLAYTYTATTMTSAHQSSPVVSPRSCLEVGSKNLVVAANVDHGGESSEKPFLQATRLHSSFRLNHCVWRLGYFIRKAEQVMVEYTKVEETPEDWSEVLSSIVHENTTVNVSAHMRSMHATAMALARVKYWRVLLDHSDEVVPDVIFEYALEADEDDREDYFLFRLVNLRDSMVVFSYAKRGTQKGGDAVSDSERALWCNTLAQLPLVETDGELAPVTSPPRMQAKTE